MNEKKTKDQQKKEKMLLILLIFFYYYYQDVMPFYTIFRPKPKETISLISADFLIKGNDAKKISDKELSELAKKKADDSKFSLRIDSKTDINSQT